MSATLAGTKEPGAAQTALAPVQTWMRGLDVSDRTCSIDGCANAAACRGWCNRHYLRWRRHGDPEAGRIADGAARAFAKAAAASRSTECILWPYGMGRNGYGRLNWEGRVQNAHRVVLELAAGPPPSHGMDAAHLPLVCHNRACVAPAHLRWATVAENAADRVLDGTVNRGQVNGLAKLTEEQVLKIYQDDRTLRAIGTDYGVTEQAVSNIKRGRSWGWLTGTGQ